MKLGKNQILELARYSLGGGTGAGLNILTAYLLTSKLGFYYLYSYIVGSLVNYTFNFLFHRAITFNTRDKTTKRAVFYYTSNIILGLIALGITYLLTSVAGIKYLVSGVISSVAIVLINYLFSKLVTFNKQLK